MAVICADTDEEARRLAASARMAFALLRRGELIAIPPPERALEFLAQHGAGAGAQIPGRRALVGSPETVRAQLEEVVAGYGAQEAIIVTITYDHRARVRSYELLASAFST